MVCKLETMLLCIFFTMRALLIGKNFVVG